MQTFQRERLKVADERKYLLELTAYVLHLQQYRGKEDNT